MGRRARGKELTISAAADTAARGVVHLGASASFGTSGGGDFGGGVSGSTESEMETTTK